MRIIWTEPESATAIGARLEKGPSADIGGAIKDANFQISRRFPLFLDKDLKVHVDAYGFLRRVAMISGSTTSPRTLETYAESLLHWLSYLEDGDIDYLAPNEGVLAAYRNSMMGQPPNTNKAHPKPKSAKTINLRITVVIEFYKHVLDRTLDEIAQARNDDTLRACAATLSRFLRTAKKIRVRVKKRRPRTILPDLCKSLYAELEHPHRLIFLWSLATGLRTSSILSLTMGDYRKAESAYFDGFLDVWAKGGKIVSAYISKVLLAETHRYVNLIRSSAVGREKKGASRVDSLAQPLFINSVGRPVTRNCYYKAFKRACKRLDADTHPHRARATFASRVKESLDAERRRRPDGDEYDSTKIVQGLLGHSNSTTTDEYLDSILRPNLTVSTVLDAFPGISPENE